MEEIQKSLTDKLLLLDIDRYPVGWGVKNFDIIC